MQLIQLFIMASLEIQKFLAQVLTRGVILSPLLFTIVGIHPTMSVNLEDLTSHMTCVFQRKMNRICTNLSLFIHFSSQIDLEINARKPKHEEEVNILCYLGIIFQKMLELRAISNTGSRKLVKLSLVYQISGIHYRIHTTKIQNGASSGAM